VEIVQILAMRQRTTIALIVQLENALMAVPGRFVLVQRRATILRFDAGSLPLRSLPEVCADHFPQLLPCATIEV
jgi:hypothetical protein